jgi:hypothetical protein
VVIHRTDLVVSAQLGEVVDTGHEGLERTE